MQLGRIAHVDTSNLPIEQGHRLLKTGNRFYVYTDARQAKCIGTIDVGTMTDGHGKSRVYTIKRLHAWYRTLKEAVQELVERT